MEYEDLITTTPNEDKSSKEPPKRRKRTPRGPQPVGKNLCGICGVTYDGKRCPYKNYHSRMNGGN